MRHLKHNTQSPLAFIDDVIASKHARGGDDVIEETRAKCKAAGKPIPPALTYKERCSELRRRNEKIINMRKPLTMIIW